MSEKKSGYSFRPWHLAALGAAAWLLLSYCGRMLGDAANQEAGKGVELKETPPAPVPAKKPRRNRKH